MMVADEPVVAAAHCSQLLKHSTTTIAFLLLFRANVHFTHYFREHFVNICSVFGTSLDERTAPELRQRVPLDSGNLPLVLQVHLVGDQENGNPFRTFDSGDELLHGPDVLEGLVVGQTVDHHEPLPVLDVQIPHAGELLRACGVQDFQHAGGVVHLDLLTVEILDGRVVFFHEATRHKLNRQCTFANPTRPENDYFKLTHCAAFLQIYLQTIITH